MKWMLILAIAGCNGSIAAPANMIFNEKSFCEKAGKAWVASKGGWGCTYQYACIPRQTLG